MRPHSLWITLEVLVLILMSTDPALAFGRGRKADAKLPPPVLVAVLGDSISAGTFAETRASPDRKSSTVSIESEVEAESVLIRLLKATGVYENKTSYSWASGTKIRSHFVRIREALAPQPVEVFNAAVPGAQARDLESQAQEIAEAMRSGRYASLKYLMVLIGANDACNGDSDQGTPNARMRASLERALAVIAGVARAGDPTRILISSIPRVPELGADSVKFHKTLYFLNCGYVRNRVLHECDRLTTWHDEGDLIRSLAVVDAKNRLLEDFAHAMNARYRGALELYFSHRLEDTSITPGMLAFDCFHPNRDGHQQIADELWADQPWFK